MESELNHLVDCLPIQKAKRPHYPAIRALCRHWLLYLMEAAELALFMLALCGFSTLLFHPDSVIVQASPNLFLRRVFMGILMGCTTIAIIRSPIGKRSGAHFNPAVTLAFFWLGKVSLYDTMFYVAAHFLGGITGVLLSSLLFGLALADPAVDYAVTIPGQYGDSLAFFTEAVTALVMMGVVLRMSNHWLLYKYTSLAVGLITTLHIALLTPASGFSVNPARTVSSGLFAGVRTSVWIYLIGPVLGMTIAAEQFARTRGVDKVFCAKLQHTFPCHFRCRFFEFLAGKM